VAKKHFKISKNEHKNEHKPSSEARQFTLLSHSQKGRKENTPCRNDTTIHIKGEQKKAQEKDGRNTK